MKQPVRVVIVVHGMGESKQNETVLGVISRFADARSPDEWPPARVVTLGAACGQTGTPNVERFVDPATAPEGQPWVEFKNIPADERTAKGIFVGEPQVPSTGENICFVDIHWDDLLSTSYGHVGEDVNLWVEGLLGRLKRRRQEEFRKTGKADAVPFWATEMLGAIQNSIKVLRFWTKWRAEKLDATFFGKYLGDVQVYGEYAQIRGEAVRRFHRILQAVDTRFMEKGLTPTYTVLAHSLGTVMAIDALLYACADKSVRSGLNTGCQNLPFAGYVRAGESIPDVSWISRVHSFVTLGSPIDKFLVIWWLNYHFLRFDGWIDPKWRAEDARKIKHFNYCEEQDPVGHHLDLAHSTKAVSKLFERCQDVVYTRYALPGLAHVAYWKDQVLFKHIVEHAVDDRPAKAADGNPVAVDWFNMTVFRRSMRITYLWAPLLITVVDAYAFTLAYRSESPHVAVFSIVTFFAITLLGRYVLDLLLWWRQVLKAKQRVAAPLKKRGHARTHHAPSDQITCMSAQVAEKRVAAERRTRAWIAAYQWVPLTLCGMAAVLMFSLRWDALDWTRISCIAAGVATLYFVWERLFYSANKAGDRKNAAENAFSRVFTIDFAKKGDAEFADVHDKGLLSGADTHAVGSLAGVLFLAFCVTIFLNKFSPDLLAPLAKQQWTQPRFLFTFCSVMGSMAVVFGFVRARHKEIRSSFFRDRG